jgi:tRNA-dihydrouridine synthase B
LKDLPRLRDIVRATVEAVQIPVTVKVRVGWDDNLITLFETQDIVEGEGGQAFVIHGRTRMQAYRGLANWDLIAAAKRRAKIPVIGNGDVLKVADILDKLEKYGVDGIAVGRGAMHNPWIFRDIADLYEGRIPQEPTALERHQLFLDYERMLREQMDIDGRVLGKLKQMAARLMKLQKSSTLARLSLLRSQSLPEFHEHLTAFFASPEANAARDYSALSDLNGRHEPMPTDPNSNG